MKRGFGLLSFSEVLFFRRMFTGIIQEIGIVQSIIKTPSGKKLKVTSKKLAKELKKGDSLAVDGVCLTLIHKQKNEIEFEIIPETLEKSHFKNLQKHAEVNLEPPLKIGEKLSGHLTLGHIDGTGKVKKVIKKGDGRTIEIFFPEKLNRYIAEKGCIAMNGVSLTIAKKEKNFFAVALTPYTGKNTNLMGLKKGMLVNIEVDLIARYIRA